MAWRVAVAGANTAAGREVLRALAESALPLGEVIGLGTGRSAGQEVGFGDARTLRLRALDGFDFAGTDVAILALGAAEARAAGPRASAAGAYVLDLSAAHRMEPGVPLVVPGVNLAALGRFKRRRMAALPAPAAAFAALALQPLRELAPVTRLVALVLEPTSGAGKEGMDELFTQTRASFVNDLPSPQQFPKPIAFNVIPQVGAFGEDGQTEEEAGLGLALRKVLDPDLVVGASAVRVPVFLGTSLALHVAFAEPLGVAEARAALGRAPGLAVFDRREEGGYATPLDVAGEGVATVSRLRRDPGAEHGLALWVVGDDLRWRGGAVVGVLEALAREGLVGG
ncbi:MAG: aspartate-semialdehyde dehydrogenase [Rubritepida sp.]|nr:aspartate-semialdehyde dehydrogenase [Rubritepida sp.]